MIEADIRGRIPEVVNSEDILTATVFGMLKYAPMRTSLEQFIGKATLYGNELTFFHTVLHKVHLFEDEVKTLFWQYDEKFGVPDIILEGKDCAVVVEVKFKSDLHGKDQLRKYHALLMQRYPEKSHKHVIYLTRDLSYPEQDTEVTQGIEKNLWWLSWYELYGVLEQMKTNDSVGRELCEDLKRFLIHRELYLFRGITVPEILPQEHFFWNDTIPLITEYDFIPKVSVFFWRE